MKTALLLASGILGATLSWQVCAQQENSNPTSPSADMTANSEGPATAATTMSGGPAAHQKTRAEVYQDLIRFQQDGQADQLREVYKGQ
jgi:hypothetical protein